MKRTVTERDLWPNAEPMYHGLEVTATISKPVVETVTVTMPRDYAKRLQRVLEKARNGPYLGQDLDVTILQRLVEEVLTN